MEFIILLVEDPQAAWWIQLFPLFLILFIFYLLLFRPLKKEKEQHRNLLANLKKNDRVITQGGIYGVVANITDREVTVKVDDSNNVKIKFAKSSIVGVIPKGDKKGNGSKENSAPPKEESTKKGKKGKKGKKK